MRIRDIIARHLAGMKAELKPVLAERAFELIERTFGRNPPMPLSPADISRALDLAVRKRLHPDDMYHVEYVVHPPDSVPAQSGVRRTRSELNVDQAAEA